MTLYRITTRETHSCRFTPQLRCPCIVRGLGGLRRAFRELQSMGYGETERRDPDVRVRQLHPSSITQAPALSAGISCH